MSFLLGVSRNHFYYHILTPFDFFYMNTYAIIHSLSYFFFPFVPSSSQCSFPFLPILKNHIPKRKESMAALLGDSTLPEEVPNLRFTDPQQLDTLKIINIVTNVISAISAFLVLAILFAMRCYDRRLVDRVSLRLAAAVSLTDLISSISLIAYSYLSNGTTSAVISCQIIAFLIIWLTNQYLFLTTASGFDLERFSNCTILLLTHVGYNTLVGNCIQPSMALSTRSILQSCI